MSTFHARMHEAKRAKRDRLNRGESIGDFRGTVKPIPREVVDELERDIARVVHRIARPLENFACELYWIVLEINDPTMTEIPF